MDSKKYKILILEDTPTDAKLVERELEKSDLCFVSKHVDTREDFSTALDTFIPDIILSDYSLPNFDALSALAIVKEKCPDVPFILVTGTIGEEAAVESVKMGVVDYVLKDRLVKLMPAVKRALRDAEANSKLQEKTINLEKLVNSMVGRELKMVELKKTIAELNEQIVGLKESK